METRCAAFWKHTNIRQSKKIYPCCRFKTSVGEFDGDFSKILHSLEYEELRKKSLNNEYINGCVKCYNEESTGKISVRQLFNEKFDIDTVSLEFLEIGFDNICNLTCDPCGPEFSHTWSKKLDPKKIIHIETIKEDIDPPESIKLIRFLGGEPLMTNRHNKFLMKVHDKKNVEVVYNTNGTFLLKNEDIILLKQFKSVVFIVGIDGYSELNDKVRTGSLWTDILKFLHHLEENSFKIKINTVIHANNWKGLGELAHFVYSKNYTWRLNLVTYPKNLDIANCKNKEEITAYFNTIDFPNKDYIINHLKATR